jgi:hypothetical protein
MNYYINLNYWGEELRTVSYILKLKELFKYVKSS